MRRADFSLVPFSAARIPAGTEINGSVDRDAGIFSIRYELRGPLKQLVIPVPADTLARADRLWENTCFEFFLSPKNSDRYWEFNLSPSGRWNVYRFASFRQGMSKEHLFTALPFSVEARRDSLVLYLKVGLSAFIREDQKIAVGITAVVRLIDGTLTYWALKHPGPKPDFHRRDSFILEL